MPRKYVETVVSEIEFQGACGKHHTFRHAWNPRISDNKNWLYQKIARETVEDACIRCVLARGYFVRPENRREPLPVRHACGHPGFVGFGKRLGRVQRQRYLLQQEQRVCGPCQEALDKRAAIV